MPLLVLLYDVLGFFYLALEMTCRKVITSHCVTCKLLATPTEEWFLILSVVVEMENSVVFGTSFCVKVWNTIFAFILNV